MAISPSASFAKIRGSLPFSAPPRLRGESGFPITAIAAITRDHGDS